MAATGWWDLPSELLTHIAGGLTELADIARFRSVCSSWRAAAVGVAAAPPPQLPWLLLPSSPSRLFFCPREDRLYPDLRMPAPTAEAHRRLYASPYGWTLGIDPTDLAASLFHPFTGAAVPLPSLPAVFAEIDDLAWDWSPHGVMASCGFGPFFCSLDPLAESWAPIAAMPDCNASSINYAAGVFFVFEEYDCLTTIVDAITLAVAAVIRAPAVELPVDARIAVAGDELFLLVTFKWWMRPPFSDHVDFSKTFSVDYRSADPAWQEITDIGARALFVDSLHGFAVETAGFGNLEGNTIYSVTSEEYDRRSGSTTVKHSVSVFSLDNRSSKKIACRLNGLEMPLSGEAPSWIIPSLNEG